MLCVSRPAESCSCRVASHLSLQTARPFDTIEFRIAMVIAVVQSWQNEERKMQQLCRHAVCSKSNFLFLCIKLYKTVVRILSPRTNSLLVKFQNIAFKPGLRQASFARKILPPESESANSDVADQGQRGVGDHRHNRVGYTPYLSVHTACRS